MQVFTMPAESWDESNPSKQVIRHLISKHAATRDHLVKLKQYYEGQHEILGEKDKQNKLVCNHAKDITDTASAYFLGNPVTYDCDDDEQLKILQPMLDDAGADEVDGDNAQDLSIYGRAYEYLYVAKDETSLRIKNLAPENTFKVYDDTIEQNELFAVYYYARKDDTDRTNTKYVATVLTEHYIWVLDIQDTDAWQPLTETCTPHFFGEVPVIEWKNNKLALGDYELQIPLIDAYNALMSDRVTDKEQFIDAILVIYGTLLSDEDSEEEGDGKGAENAEKKLKRRKLLELPDTSKAEYLVRTFDEAGVEILKKAIEQDIHKFSHIPCMTDESFGGNVSGVAMEFKLLGLENITKIKSRYYRIGLRKRLRMFCNYLQVKNAVTIDPTQITATFSRALPKNLLEISQYVNNLKGIVSRGTLLAQIPFVDDPAAEMDAVDKENEEAIRQQQELFKAQSQANTPPDEEEPVEKPTEPEKKDEEEPEDEKKKDKKLDKVKEKDE